MQPPRKDSRRQRSARSCPDGKPDLQFVSVKPDDPEQGARTRTIVRANAAHFHWRHNRPPRNKAKAKAQRPGHRADPRHDKKTAYSLPSVTSTQLNGADVNPFSPCDYTLPRTLINHCIAFNAQVILPAIFPDGANSFNIKANLLQMSTSNHYVLHMFITGTLLNSQGIRRVTLSNRVAQDMFRSRAEIIRGLNVAMQDPTEACKDINIFAVVALAKNEMRREVQVSQERPNQGPLKDLQLLNIMALSEIDPIHFDGLSRLVELKGGLDRIEMSGLAHLISLGGIIVATKTCTSPRFPAVVLSNPASGFMLDDQATGRDTDQDIDTVLSMLRKYTTIVDDFFEGRKVISTSELIDHRNVTQHALLSLPPRVGRPECIRLAMLIYSLLVVFPLPYHVAPFQYLVTQLKNALTEWGGDDCILLWVLTMGTIGATGLKEREWFVRNFRYVTTRRGVDSWSEARDIIKRVLWHEATNDRDGQDLWLESRILDLT